MAQHNLVMKLDQMESSKALLGTKYSENIFKNSTHIIGFCFDGTASFRPGSRIGPDAIRDASVGIETYSPYLEKDLEDFSIYDCGNLPIYPSKWKLTNYYFHGVTQELRLKEDKIKFLILGGEHSVSYGPIRLCLDQYKDLVIVHLDAHTDLRDGYLEEKYSHASIIRRVWDHMDANNQLIQYGIRSGLKEEFDFMQEHNTLSHSLSDCLDKIAEIDAKRPVYLTLDLDFFDPAYLPGTGTPEAGGEDFHSFMKILKALNGKNLVGADVVELAPSIDPTGNSAVFAAKATREILLAMQ
jgi:agmatinase